MSLNILAMICTVFLVIYNQLVCPFLESRPFTEELINLLIVFGLMILVREILFQLFKVDIEKPFFSKTIQKLYILSWIISGFLAVALHEYIYHNIDPDAVHQLLPWPSDYPWHSHLKVLSGYWFLGAGLLAQLELFISEDFIRDYLKRTNQNTKAFSEKISSRITWGNFVYAFVPSASMLIMVLRYAIQDMMIPLAISGEIAYIGTIFVITALAAARIYGKRLKKDTIEITDAINNIGKGEFDTRLWPTREDELGLIANGINNMAQGLQHREKIKESFGHFVSPEIVEKVIDQYSQDGDIRTHGEKKKVAILMCDIRNFSGMAENLPPSEMVEMLNNYFDHMVKAIKTHGGLVDKFIGDAVMAVFGLEEGNCNCSHQAVKAAQEIRSELVKFNEERAINGKPPINNGVGLHYGEVVASFLGSSERLEFTVIGSTVNVAARLESQAKEPNPPIIFSREVAIEVKDHYKLTKVGEEHLKGVGLRKMYSIKN